MGLDNCYKIYLFNKLINLLFNLNLTDEEGKKVNWKDGLKAIYYIFKFRFNDQN